MYKESIEFNIPVECVLHYVTGFLKALGIVDEHVVGTVNIALSSLKKVVDLEPPVFLLQKARGLKVGITAQLYKDNPEYLQVVSGVFDGEVPSPLREYIRLACNKVKVKFRESKETKLPLKVVADDWQSWLDHETHHRRLCH